MTPNPNNIAVRPMMLQNSMRITRLRPCPLPIVSSLEIIRIKSVNAWEKLFSKANLAAFKENVNIDLINTSDGTFNDYSTTSSSHYKHICDSLATSYELSFIELCKTTKIAPESVSTKIVR